MPWLAAWIACTPLELPSSRFDRSPDRWSRDCEVKKVTGLSRAEETFLPVASRFLGGGRQRRRILQGEQVLAGGSGERDADMMTYPFWLRHLSFGGERTLDSPAFDCLKIIDSFVSVRPLQ